MKKIINEAVNTAKIFIGKTRGKGPEFLEAVSNGDINKVSQLLSQKANRQFQDPETGSSAMHIAVEKNDLDLLQMICRLGIDKTLKDANGYTALMYAIENNQQKAIKLIFDTGNAAIGEENNFGETIVNIALRQNQLKVALFLKDRGEDLDQALKWAATNQDEFQLEWLVKHGAKAAFTDEQGFSPLFRAIDQEDLRAFQKWIEFGADINMTEGVGPAKRPKGWTPLMEVLNSNRLTFIDYMLAIEDLSLIAETDKGMTAPIIAAEKGLFEIIQKFESMGFNLACANKNGYSLVMAATKSGHLPLVEYLVSRSPNSLLEQDEKGWTALMYATDAVQPVICEYLVRSGSDKATRSHELNFTALDIAKNRFGTIIDPRQKQEMEKIIHTLS